MAFETSFKAGGTRRTNNAELETKVYPSSNQILSVRSFDELEEMRKKYADELALADLCILFDAEDNPSKVFIWQTKDRSWREISALSQEGLVLMEASLENKGLVQFAAHNENTGMKAVQGDDPRLHKQWWEASSTAPEDTSVIWIDNSDPNEILEKWFDGENWIVLSGDGSGINDAGVASDTTYSSAKISKLLSGKSDQDHDHAEFREHLLDQSNPHQVRAVQIEDLKDYVHSHNDVQDLLSVKHSHSNKSVLESLGDTGGKLSYKGLLVGTGDMHLQTFDKNKNGILDAAETLTDGVLTYTPEMLQAIEKSAHAHPNLSVLQGTQESFTTALKNKLDNIADEANRYVHPNSHSADMIVESETKKFVTPEMIERWDAKYSPTQIVDLLEQKVNKSEAIIVDPTGKIPLEMLPMAFKDSKVAGTIFDRDLMNKYAGLRVYVADASDDPKVGSGSAEYLWSGTAWITLTDYGLSNETMKFFVDEANDQLLIKIKYADGTLKSGTLPLA